MKHRNRIKLILALYAAAWAVAFVLVLIAAWRDGLPVN